MSLIVYCDTGGYRKELKKYGKNITLVMFEYENTNKNISNDCLPASNLTYDDLENSPATVGDLTFDSFDSSDKIKQIEQIVGKENQKDVFHLDSAFKSNCDIFLTSDNDDIYSNKEDLEKLLSFKIFLSTKQLPLIEDYINKLLVDLYN